MVGNARDLNGNINFYGIDDEWPEFLFSDEILNHNEAINKHTLGGVLPEGGAPILKNYVFKWGGECRLELDVNFQAAQTGEVQVFGVARFYEGTTEDTDQLEDIDGFSFTVHRGGEPYTHQVVLLNETWGDPDEAYVNFTLTNHIVEVL